MGLLLTGDENKMDIIKQDHKNDTEAALQAVFNHWLTICETASWNKLVSALQEMGENALALNLKKKYCQS